MKAINGKEYLDMFPNFELVNRSEDIERISSILCRKKNNSLLITGPEGVGVSSILLGLQQLKSSTEASFAMQAKQFFWLDIDSLFASGDTQQINTEFQSIISNLVKTPDSVLIIPNGYTFLEAARNSGNSHFINIINNADKSKSFQVIIEVNDNQLSNVYKENPSTNEFYTLYDVKELKGKELEESVAKASESLVDYHGIKVDDSAIKEAIKLTSKYRDDFGLGNAQPSRSLNLLDRTVSSYKQACVKKHPALVKLEKEIENCEDLDKKAELKAIYEDSFKDWSEAKQTMSKLTNYQSECEALRIKYESEIEELKQKTKEKENSDTVKSFLPGISLDSPEVLALKKKIKEINAEIASNKEQYQELSDKFNKNLIVTKNEVINEFGKISGISSAKLNENEIESLKALETNMLSQVFGQDEAIKHICNAIKVAKIDTVKESGPAASYLLVGPSGVGKTQTSKALAENLFGDERALIRFDMSEYMEKHAVAKLIGAPPGYEGFECGGILTNTVRKNPVGIYLFDEIEKAHPDVFNIFLQILSDGRLTDNVGRTVDFSEAIIIMTSNIGQKYYLDVTLSDEEARRLATEELNNTYRSELLNRFNGRENILHFKRLPIEIIEKIVKREIDKLNTSYKEKNLTISVSDTSIKAFCHDHYDIVKGARGLPGYIKANVRPIIVNHILNNPNSKGIFEMVYNKEIKTFEVNFIEER